MNASSRKCGIEMAINLTRDIELEPHRCYDCNQWWAWETRSAPASRRCPYCAQDAVGEARRRRDVAEHSAAALRGVIKRMRNRK